MYEKKGRKGGWMLKQAKEQKYLNADRYIQVKEIILSSLVRKRKGGGGDS